MEWRYSHSVLSAPPLNRYKRSMPLCESALGRTATFVAFFCLMLVACGKASVHDEVHCLRDKTFKRALTDNWSTIGFPKLDLHYCVQRWKRGERATTGEFEAFGIGADMDQVWQAVDGYLRSRGLGAENFTQQTSQPDWVNDEAGGEQAYFSDAPKQRGTSCEKFFVSFKKNPFGDRYSEKVFMLNVEYTRASPQACAEFRKARSK